MTELGERLLDTVQNAFFSKLKNDKKLKRIANKVRDGTDYGIANDYSIRVGELLAESVQENTQTVAYMSAEDARELLTPLLTADHQIITEATDLIQANMNDYDGVRLGVQTPELDTDRIEGLIQKVSSYESYDDAKWVLNEPLVNFSQAIVDQAIRDNARITSMAGGKAYIKRETESFKRVSTTKKVKSKKGKVYSYPYTYTEPCNWCINLAGTYEYSKLGTRSDVYRKHEGCRCTLTWVRGKERRDLWSAATWTGDDAEARRKAVEAATQERERQATAKANAQRRETMIVERIMNETGYSAKAARMIARKNKKQIERAGIEYVIASILNQNDFAGYIR